MSKLDDYSKLVVLKQEAFQSLVRSSGPYSFKPTNKGRIIFSFKDKDIQTDMSPKELKELRDLIDCFLDEVVE